MEEKNFASTSTEETEISKVPVTSLNEAEQAKNVNETEVNNGISSVNGEKLLNKPSSVWEVFKKLLSYIFIDGFSGMATGLFATLIIGTIICQIGSFIPGSIGYFIKSIGTIAKIMMGAGIGVGMSLKLKKKPMVTVSAASAGMVGAFASKIISKTIFNEAMTVSTLAGVGEPLGAFVASFAAIEVGNLVVGKTKIDIIVTPLLSILAGSILGLLVGPSISKLMTFIGKLININVENHPIIGGAIVSALMGIALTLPISSAAIGISLGLDGVAAGAAVVGCCCQMIGFAFMSFKENRFGGIIAQGLGTSMLQIPNLIKNPRAWIPPVLSSLILGPIATSVFHLKSNAVGSGMGTSGLVGIIQTFMVMTEDKTMPAMLAVLIILTLCIVWPAVLAIFFSFILKKLKWLKTGDLKLDL